MKNQNDQEPFDTTENGPTGEEISPYGTSVRERIAAAARDKRIIVAAAVFIGISLLVMAVWIWQNKGSDEGKPVPAPRDTSVSQGNSDALSSGETTITLSAEQLARAGIKIETVGETLSSDITAMTSTGVVQPNAYNETPVISLVGGVIRRANVELGQNVAKGQTVATVFSDEFGAAESRFLSLQTEAQTARQNYQRASKLLGINPASRSDFDQAQARLKTKEAELDEMQRRYKRTVRLIEIGAASREELEQDRTKLKAAEADVEQARRQLERSSQLVSLAPASNAEFEQAAVKLRTSETELAAARQKLIVLGLAPQKVDSLRSPSQISSELALAAPISGTVTARNVNPGETVEANKELLKITDLSTVWVIAQVYEKDLSFLRTGSGASVTSNTYPGRLFRGRVTYIDPNVNQETRTAQVRVELENPGQIFKIGMYVNVAFGAMGMAEKTMPMIPAAAVQNINNQTIVFAATDNPNTFILRPVRVVDEKDKKYVVLEGLNVGDRIVVDGSFLLRAEWVKQRPGG